MKIKDQEIKIGDFLVSSWGYDQTNIDFFKVVKLTAKNAKVVRVKSKIVEQGTQENGVIPTDEIDENILLNVREGDYPKIDKFYYVSLWDGEKKWKTAPGYGH